MTSNDDIVQISKVIILNAAALTVSYMGFIVEVLQALLILITIGYTIYKWLDMHNKKKKK